MRARLFGSMARDGCAGTGEVGLCLKVVRQVLDANSFGEKRSPLGVTEPLLDPRQLRQAAGREQRVLGEVRKRNRKQQPPRAPPSAAALGDTK